MVSWSFLTVHIIHVIAMQLMHGLYTVNRDLWHQRKHKNHSSK